jgi:hypothetical protein
MKKALSAIPLALASIVIASTAYAQTPRIDVWWARQAPGAVITLDGVLDEPAWASAETKVVRYGIDNASPGSGFQEEGGHLAKDSTNAVFKFLVVGNQLYMGVTVRDSSVGGGPDFNRFDGLLMSIKNHSVGEHPAPPTEYFYSWWYPDTCDHAQSAQDKVPDFRGLYGNHTPQCDPRPQAMIDAWNAKTRVQGHSNLDTAADTGYVVEMRFDLGVLGYNVTLPQGDVIEFNVSIYDTDWYWPLSLARFASNRVWWQSPWGNAMWYHEVELHSMPGVTINSGALPTVAPDVQIKNAAAFANPVIDGFLTEPVWASAPSIRIHWDDNALRDTYPGVLKWRAGQFQPPVNGGTSGVFDPGDATVKWFFKNDSLYMGFDVKDECVQYVNLTDRWDGFIVTLNDKAARGRDRNLAGRRITFHVGPGGTGVAEDYLLSLRDTLSGAKFALKLKPNTTVDTVCVDTDEGYTAELMVVLTKIGYPPGRGDGILWAGFDLLDGDSFIPSTLSYGTRTWWARQYENECCPAWAYMDPASTVGVGDEPRIASGFAVLGNSPNPFRVFTMIRYSLDRPSRVRLDVFDLQGRRVTSRDLGLRSSRESEYAFHDAGLKSGLYLYRLSAIDPENGSERASGSGKMMFMN